MAENCPPGSAERAALSDFWIARLVQLTERRLATMAAERAELVGLLAAQRAAADDLAPDRPGAAGPDTQAARVPELMDVSEWLPCELAMLHPYGGWAVDDLVRVSLRLTGRFTATLELLRRGKIDYERARRVTDLLAPLDEVLATRVEGIVLPKAAGQTPQQLAAGIRRAIDRIDAAARIRRHERARAAANVAWWPTEDGMARLAADLPVPVAAACGNAVDAWARQQRAGGDARPIGQIRADVLADLILRPWADRPTVSAHVVVHAPLSALAGGDEPGEVDGHSVSAAQCRELLEQLDALGVQRPECGTLAVAVHTTDEGHDSGCESECTGCRTDASSPPRPGRLVAVGTRRALERGASGPGLRRPPATDRYRPTEGQRRFVQARDRLCRHPHCPRKVGRTDIDHDRPWPAGRTDCDNLCCLCRKHHRLKTHERGWRFRLRSNGKLAVTTPSGSPGHRAAAGSRRRAGCARGTPGRS